MSEITENVVNQLLFCREPVAVASFPLTRFLSRAGSEQPVPPTVLGKEHCHGPAPGNPRPLRGTLGRVKHLREKV